MEAQTDAIQPNPVSGSNHSLHTDSEFNNADGPPTIQTPQPGRIRAPIVKTPEQSYSLPSAPKFDRFRHHSKRIFLNKGWMSIGFVSTQLRGCVRSDFPIHRSLNFSVDRSMAYQYSLNRTARGKSFSKQRSIVRTRRGVVGTSTTDDRVMMTRATAHEGGEATGTEEMNVRTQTVKASMNLDSLAEAGLSAEVSASVSHTNEMQTSAMDGESGQIRRDTQSQDTRQYVVMGLFSQVTGVPNETLIRIRTSEGRRSSIGLFRSMSVAVMRIRGIGAVFSLKDVKAFGIYQVRSTKEQARSGQVRPDHHPSS